ncbi:TPA: hypothetical protein ACSZG7_05885, partial [Listeria monocytogenes]
MNIKRLQKVSYFLHIALKILSISSVIMTIIVVFLKFFRSTNIMRKKLESDTVFSFQTEFFAGGEKQQYNQMEEGMLVVIAAFSRVVRALLLWTASMIFKDLAAEFMPFSDLTVN